MRRPEEKHLRLPPGYRLDRSDPDVWVLRRAGGWIVAHFSAQGVTYAAIEQVTWEDHESLSVRRRRVEGASQGSARAEG